VTESTAHRADFRRNEQRIFDAAARVLADDPTAGMAEIADRAELGRATLYRHFASREALIEGVRRVADDAAGVIVERHTAPGAAGSPVERLQAILAELLDVGDRYRFLLAHPAGTDTHREMRRARYGTAMTALVRSAQEAGELDPAADPAWVLMAFGGLVQTGARAMSRGDLTLRDAKRFVIRGLLTGYGPPSST
jgi:TetR/AcrR family transcriptional regulator, mexCD-oprJ operon repressor